MFIGTYKAPIIVSTGASTLMLSLDKPIRFKTQEMNVSRECMSLLIPAGTSVIFDLGEALIINCTLDPSGNDFNRIAQMMHKSEGRSFYQLKDEKKLIKNCQRTNALPDDTTSLKMMLQLLHLDPLIKNAIISPITHDLDPRAKKIIEVIQATINENLSLSELATEANMSPSRLVQIFKQQTGLPVRRYRLWYRLYTAAYAVGQGKNLTEAAAFAGFTDSSHFNRTVRSMLNIKPSYIFSCINPVRILKQEHTPQKQSA